MLVISQITTKLPLGASWGIIQRGVFLVVGVIHPWGMGIPCRFVSRSKPTTIVTRDLSQSATITTLFSGFFEQFFRGFLGPIYDLKTLRVTVLLMTLIVNHFGLADCRIDVNRRKRGRAHPQYTCRAGQKRFSRKSGHFRQAVYCSSNIPGSSQLVIKIQKLMLRVRLVKQPVISPSIPWAHPC